MRIEANFQVRPNQVSIQILQAEMWVEIPNLIAYDLASQKIIAIGETPESLERQDPVKWEALKSKIGFAAAFDAHSFNPLFAAAVIHFHTRLAHAKLRPGAQYFIHFLDQIDCHLQFTKYESLPADVRQAFEYSTQAAAGLNTLSVNGRSVGWPAWQRTTAASSWQFINLGLIIGVFSYGFLPRLSSAFQLLPPNLTGPITTWETMLVAMVGVCVTLAVCFALLYAVEFLGLVIWLAIIGRILPKSLLRVMLPSFQKGLLLKIPTSLVNFFLSESETSGDPPVYG